MNPEVFDPWFLNDKLMNFSLNNLSYKKSILKVLFYILGHEDEIFIAISHC
jgi:hypothetical protein